MAGNKVVSGAVQVGEEDLFALADEQLENDQYDGAGQPEQGGVESGADGANEGLDAGAGLGHFAQKIPVQAAAQPQNGAEKAEQGKNLNQLPDHMIAKFNVGSIGFGELFGIFVNFRRRAAIHGRLEPAEAAANAGGPVAAQLLLAWQAKGPDLAEIKEGSFYQEADTEKEHVERDPLHEAAFEEEGVKPGIPVGAGCQTIIKGNHASPSAQRHGDVPGKRRSRPGGSECPRGVVFLARRQPGGRERRRGRLAALGRVWS